MSWRQFSSTALVQAGSRREPFTRNTGGWLQEISDNCLRAFSGSNGATMRGSKSDALVNVRVRVDTSKAALAASPPPPRRPVMWWIARVGAAQIPAQSMDSPFTGRECSLSSLTDHARRNGWRLVQNPHAGTVLVG